MNKPLLIILLLNITSLHLFGQSCRSASVELSAVVQEVPPRISLSWVPDTSATNHFIYRKLKNGTSWGAVYGTVPGAENSFVDTAVSVGVSYEYRVYKQAATYTGDGYINSGIKIPLIEKRGNVILLIDSTFADALTIEIDRLEEDFEGDGWKMIRHVVPRSMKVNIVKMLIQDSYSQNPLSTKTVLILGRVPVPYSGEINVDGHGDHTGAYPADVYYADVNGVWTDNAINNTTAGDPRNHNVPEDGKFDQGLIPSDVELQIGRVDFYNMPSIGLTEEEMLRNYLDKDHEYRHKIFHPVHRALVDDNFGYFSGEAFAASGYKNAAPLVGKDNVITGEYFPTLNDSSYLWSYGCGGGWYQGAGGVGTTNDFAIGNVQTVFTMLFGSYFGDWDTPDNFLRAPLAKGRALTNVWSGRPHWQFHHMGLGEHIGYDVRLSQNNNGIYFFNFGARLVHMAFMGDPTLRNDIVAPVSHVIAQANGSQVDVTWTASPESVIGYHIYRRLNEEAYMRLNTAPLTSTSFNDTCVVPGTYNYMVRALILQTSPSGTYYNMSQGIADSARTTTPISVEADATFTNLDGFVSFINSSSGATHYLWVFGDGETSTEINPDHIYSDGDYTAFLIAGNGCDADTTYFSISITTGIKESITASGIAIYPNPATTVLNIRGEIFTTGPLSCTLYSLDGKAAGRHLLNNEQRSIDVSYLEKGIYLLEMVINEEKVVKRFVRM
ncbi:MAG: T9SS type A sorting domain-containing protein [Bacteroidota bacterium]|nr:T9SS type A sorting domain-containing protein [Bacteroidota bacterium]